MKNFKCYLMSIKRNIFTIFFILFIFCLIIFSTSNLKATKAGLNLWANSVVPSLFPFLVATELLSYTNAVNFIGRKLDKLMKPLFNMPGCSSYPFILGMISGYPVGAKTVCQIYSEGLCTKKEAEIMLAYTNNSGPLFILGTVGISMFGNTTIGIILLVTHILAATCVGIIFGKKLGKSKSFSSSPYSPFFLKKPLPSSNIDMFLFPCAILYSYIFNIDVINVYLKVFLSSVIGANSLTSSNSSFVNFLTSLSFIKIYDNVSFNPSAIILFLIFLIFLL